MLLRLPIACTLYLVACGHPATPATPAPESAAAPAASAAALAAGTLVVAVQPARALVEARTGSQLINWDLIVDNGTTQGWRLISITLTARDGSGALAWQQIINDNGVAPGIAVVPIREVAPGTQLLVMNPLFALPADVPTDHLRFEFAFASTTSETLPNLVATADVAGERWTGQTALRLPIAGSTLVWDGHDFVSHHRRWDYLFAPLRELGFDSNAGRYSLDLVPTDAAGAMVHGDVAVNASWPGFGLPVLAPAAGRVVVAVGTRADDRAVDMEAMGRDLLAVYGNLVVIDHGHGEHSLLGHLKQGSVTVAVGDEVRAGQVVAAIGASGSALFPHLHYQLQDAATAHAEGLPAYFDGFTLRRGATMIAVSHGAIDSGDLVER